MNKVILMGRLTRDPELRTTSSNVSVCSFTLAVDRRFKNANGERQADFISCTAWRQTAEFVSRYFRQGSRLALVGSIQTSSWEDNDGKRQYRTDVVADEVYFADSKRSEGNSSYQSSYGDSDSHRGSYNASGDNRRRSYNNDQQTSSTRNDSVPSYQDAFAPGPDDDNVLPFEF